MRSISTSSGTLSRFLIASCVLPVLGFGVKESCTCARASTNDVDTKRMNKHLLDRERRDLVLVELCASPDTLVRSVRTIVIEHGGRILEEGDNHPHSAAIRFEIPSKQIIEIYAFFLEADVRLSFEAHKQFFLPLQYDQCGFANTNVSLTLYSNRCGEEFNCVDSKPNRSQNGKSGLCRP